MARARSAPQPQTATTPSRKSGRSILADLIGHVVLFGMIAIFSMSLIPLYLGAFLFLADEERIESAFAALGIRFEPDTVGPDLIKGFASWFGWIALLASLRASAPAWLAPLLPPSQSWAFIAVAAIALSAVEGFGSLAIRHARTSFGWTIRLDSTTITTIKVVAAVAALLLAVLLGNI